MFVACAAVQNERDRISIRRPSTEDPDPGNGLSVHSLLRAEMESRQSKVGTVMEGVCSTEEDLANKQFASITDVCESMKQQLLILVEWVREECLLRSLCDCTVDRSLFVAGKTHSSLQ